MDISETKTLNDIAVKVGKLEAGQEASVKATNELASSVNRLVDKLDKSDDIAREALQASNVNQKRIDEVSENLKWVWRSIFASLVTSGFGFLIKFITFK
ncbi:hemolysin XhlA family protein [Paenibacillus radicis (ex Xue et al. 2023)]|uniref:Hemolysin XhlA family protein n=1 Tax=Paenibacillus radicis (ex Xue et al. 2023) TaxID=2972489 RepID=A0ABT1YJZ4_9BACL|nr:hemolysin XhlA family protein [Paenibacillus radicis (ex Xue et al. 2023)]MCR8633505.1 hemolysin XhlA family protein [Paenibacillus radicis (ex Xue et al. 2023)]